MRKLGAIAAVAALVACLAVPALAAAPVKHATVDDLGFSFGPAKLKIKKGTKVVWKWVDPGQVPHDVAVRSGPVKFHSAVKNSGTYSFVFKKKGTYHLWCTIHTYMTQTVIVK